MLLSPLSYPDLDTWRSDVSEELEALVGAEVSAFMLPEAGIYSKEFPTPTPEFLAVAGPVYEALRIAEMVVNMPVATITSGLGERRKEYVNTPYYQDFLKPRHCYEGLTLSAAPHAAATMVEIPALHLHKTRSGERFDDKAEQLLRLLLPAFTASVEMLRRLRERREGLLRMLDALGEAVLLVNAQGEVVHANRVLSEFAGRDHEMDKVADEMVRAARSVLARDMRLVSAPAVREFATDAARYRVRVSLLSEEVMGREPAVLIAAERLTPVLPGLEALRERFNLTPQQSNVALLLAEGLSDKAIAEKLSVSLNTARNHSKRVLDKMGVHSRAAVRPVLEELGA